jgi:anti-sigma factor RsiW
MTYSAADDDMACDELVELVSDYLEGSLDETTRTRVDLHLAECDGCSSYLQQFRATIATLGRVTEDQLDGGFRDRLLTAFRTWR